VSSNFSSPSEVAAAAAAAQARVVALRRDLHRHPELGWTEFLATSRVLRELRELGVEQLAFGADLYGDVARMGVPPDDVLEAAAARAAALGVPDAELEAMRGGRTGVVATLDSGRPGPAVAFRCDIDALPIRESDEPDHAPATQGFRSAHEGLMHACGHDGHTAIGVGVAAALRALGAPPAGSVRLLFQPAEEGARGAQALVDAGWLDGIDLFLAVHLSGQSDLRTGDVAAGVHDMLATSKLDVRFTGREAHFGMSPERGRSALTAASAVALLAHALPRPPGRRTLVNVGRLDAGTARNVVPGRATMLAEIRAEDADDAAALDAGFVRLVESIGTAFEVGTEVERVGASPAASSDPEAVELVRAATARLEGIRVRGVVPFEASDDAAAMMRRVQERGGRATYMKIGGSLTGTTHTPRFDFDERALEVGVAVVVATILHASEAAR
jgi:aminobenzoyl-glutamate utilization protein A